MITLLKYDMNILHQQPSSNITFAMEEESNRELAFLDTLLKRNNRKIYVLVYRNHTDTDQHVYYSSHYETSCKDSDVSFFFNEAIPLSP